MSNKRILVSISLNQQKICTKVFNIEDTLQNIRESLNEKIPENAYFTNVGDDDIINKDEENGISLDFFVESGNNKTKINLVTSDKNSKNITIYINEEKFCEAKINSQMTLQELRKKYNIPLNATFSFDEEEQIALNDESEIQVEFCVNENNRIYLKKKKELEIKPVEKNPEIIDINKIKNETPNEIKYTFILNRKHINESIPENEMLNKVRERI